MNGRSTMQIERLRTVLKQRLIPRGSRRRATWKTLYLVFRYPLGSLGVLILTAVRLFRDVRLGWIIPNRIGHFCGDVGLRFAEQQVRPSGATEIYCLDPPYPVSNDFWLKMFERNFTVRAWPRWIIRVGRRLPWTPAWLIKPHTVTSQLRDLRGVLPEAERRLEFLGSEEAEAEQWLRALGWADGEPIVCLLVRDSAYLDNEPGLAPSRGRQDLWRHHDYRDSDIRTYVPAAEWLADQGAWVFRMGKRMSHPMESDHPRVIDYAFRGDRSDFLDIWLFAHCDLCVSTGSGPDMVSVVHRRPILMIDLLPSIGLLSSAQAITAPKLLRWSRNNRLLTVSEHLAAAYTYGSEFAENGVMWHDLSAGSISSIVEEAWMRIHGLWTDGPDDARLHAAAWAALEQSPQFDRLHGYRHPEADFSSVWLRELDSEASSNRDDQGPP